MRIQNHKLYHLYYSILPNELWLTPIVHWIDVSVIYVSTEKPKLGGGKPSEKPVKRYRIQLDFRSCYRAYSW